MELNRATLAALFSGRPKGRNKYDLLFSYLEHRGLEIAPLKSKPSQVYSIICYELPEVAKNFRPEDLRQPLRRIYGQYDKPDISAIVHQGSDITQAIIAARQEIQKDEASFDDIF